MKRVLFLPLLVSLLFACKKDAVNNTDPVDSVSPATDKKPISISIADFIQEEANLRSARKKQTNPEAYAREDSARISDIYYIVYNSNGTKVNLVHQDTVNNSGSFGTITDSLAAGSYTIVLIASEKPLYIEPIKSNSNISAHSFGPSFLGAVVIDPLGDVFFKKMQIDINPTGNPTSLEVTLSRIVGKLEVNILDALPATDPNGYIGVQATPLSVAFNLIDESVSQPESSWQWIGTRTNQHTFKDYLFGTNNEFNVVITYKDKNTGEDLVKTIEHVTCHTNKKTIITGYLYGTPNHPGGPDYQVKLNQSWDSDSTVINF